MKKRLLFFIALLFAVAGIWAEATAQCTPGGPVTTASSISVCEGTTQVDVPVTVTSFNNVGVISLKMLYDHSKLGTGALFSENALLWTNFNIFNHPGAVYDTLTISGYGPGITLGAGSTLFTLRFTKGSAITTGTLFFYENTQGTSCEYTPDLPPDYNPFCDTPTTTYYIAGGVTVVPDPAWTAYNFPTTSVCNGGSVTFSVGINGGLGGVITWIRSATPGGSGTTVTSPDAPGIGTWYYRPHYAPTGVGCNLADGTETTVTVVADPSWTGYSFPVTSICNGGSVTFSAGINGGLGGVISWIRSDNPTPGTGTEITVTSPDSPGVGTWYYRPHYAPTGVGCDLTDGTQTTVTVSADPSWTGYSFPVTTLCNGGSVTFSVGINGGLGGVISWIRSDNPTPGTGTEITVTSPDSPGVGTWYYRPHYAPTGVGCDLTDGTQTTVTVVADPSWTGYSFPVTTLCNGGSVTFSAGINGGLGGVISWIRSDNPTPGTGTEVNVTSPDAPGIGTWYYRPHYAPTGVGCDLADGTQTTVTVSADPSWTGYSFPVTTLCNGGSVTFSVGINGGLGGVISWIRSDNPTPGTGTEITVTSPDSPGVGTWYYRPHYAPTGVGCDLTDGTQTTVTVVADPSWTGYSFPVTTLCNGGSVTFSAGINGGLGGVISWIRSDNPTPGTGTEVNVTSPDSPGVGTWYYRPHYAPTGVGCDLTDGTQTTVTVSADPSWTGYSFPVTTLCNGGSVTFSVGINGGLGGVISWILSDNPTPGTGTEITVTSPDSPGVGTWYYRPHYAPTGVGCDLTDGTQTTVTVVADPSWTGYSFPVTTLCNGGSVTFSAGINGGLGGVISWIRSDNPTPGAGTEVNVTSPDAPGIGTWYYRPHYAPTGVGCDLTDGTQTTVTVVADPSWTGYSFPVTTLCNGGSVTFSVGINGGLGGVISWIRSDNPTPGTGTEITVTSPDSPGVGTWYYRPHYAPTGVGCDLTDGTQTTVTVVADPSWTGYSFPVTTLCNGGSVTFSAGINGGLGGVISWIRSDNPTPGAGTEVTVTSPDSPGVGTWYYRPHYAPTGVGCDLTDGTQTTVTVVADPSWTGYSFPVTTLCNGGSVTFSVGINGGLGGVISWIRSDNPTPGTGTEITVTSPDSPGVGTWYYRPHYAPTGVGCDLTDGTQTTVTVVADPSWTGYSFPVTTLCNGGSVTFSAGINGGLGGVISWIRSDNPTPGAGTEVTVTSPDAPGIGTWYYRPQYAPTGVGCDLADGTQTTVTVSADPSWTAYSFPVTSLCNGGSVSFGVGINDGLGGSVNWIRSATPGGIGTTVTSPDAPGIGTWYYRPQYTPTGEGCNLADGTETTVTVVADPSWTGYTFPVTTLCNGGSVSFGVGINDGLGGSVNWIRSATPGGIGTTVTSPDAPGIGTWYYRPQYTPTGEGCNLADGTETTVTVVADPSWTGYTFPVTTLCNGGSVSFGVGINDGLGGAVNWIRSATPGGIGTTVTSPDAPGIGTWYYRPQYTPTGEGCNLADGTETTVTVVADPSWTGYTFPVTTLCNGGSVSFGVGINDGLGGSVNWIRSATPGGIGTTVTSPDAPGIGTWYYRPQYTPTGEGCNLADGTETTVTAVADPSWTGYTFPVTTLCNGGSVSFGVGINDGLGGAVTWIRSATPGGIGTTVTSPDAPGIGTWYYRPQYTPTGEGCNLADGTETTVTVVADPSWTGYTFPVTALCNGGSVSFGVGINDGLGGAVTWIRSATPGGIGTTVTSPDAPGIGTWYYRPQYTPTGEGCNLADGTETTVTVVADPSWTGYTFPVTTLCNGGSVSFGVSINDGLGGAVTWIRSATPGGIGTTVTSPDAPGIGTWYYRPQYTPTGEGCNLADGTETTVTVVTDPSWTGYSFPVTTLCDGGSATFDVSISGGLGGTVSWIRSDTPGGSGTTVTSPDNPGPGTWYYRPQYSPTGEGCNLADGTETMLTVNARHSISGIFYYYNSAFTVLTAQDITVRLYRSSDDALMGTTTTSNTGYYEFTNLCTACDYEIAATSTHTTEGSVNTTDAAQVNYWPTVLYSIEKVRFNCGDVTGSPPIFINGSDAQRVQSHFVSGVAFNRLPWTFWRTGETTTINFSEEWYPTVSLPVGSDATVNMYGLCTGDFNRSFNPDLTKSASSTLSLIYAGNRQAGYNQEYDLPLRMVNASEVGAVSLILNFPAELVEITDVFMKGAGGILDWAVKGNELRIGWNSQVPLNLTSDADLLILRLKTTTAFTIGNSIRISLAANPLNELADAMYNVIGDAVLSIDVIDATAVGIGEEPAVYSLALNSYPNPFSNFTTISYTLPVEGKVLLEINNILGNKVSTLVNETQANGSHLVKFDTFGLPSGVYTATLKLMTADDQLVRTIKLINNK